MINWKQEVKFFINSENKTDKYVRHFADIFEGLLLVKITEKDNKFIPEILGNGFGIRLNTAGTLEEAKMYIQAELEKMLKEII
jgi:hypothetical protein